MFDLFFIIEIICAEVLKMAKKNNRNTKSKIVNAAWRLFYEQGYDNTTVEEIIDESGTSKGSFYHYFDGKDALLGTLSTLFDEKYDELEPQLTDDMGAMEKLIFLNNELFLLIESSVPLELLTRLLSTQLVTNGNKHLLDKNRTYFKLLRKIISQGQDSGEFSDSLTVGEMLKYYALAERALMYDWCLCGGEYSLKQYGLRTMPGLLSSFIQNTITIQK